MGGWMKGWREGGRNGMIGEWGYDEENDGWVNVRIEVDGFIWIPKIIPNFILVQSKPCVLYIA